MALELRSEGDGVERDFVRRDLHDAEFVEELPAFFAEALDERLVGRLAAKDAARVAVHVGEDEVDVVLAERVEARAVFEDSADLAVMALHVRFLRRAVGVAVEHADAPRRLQRRVAERVWAVFLDHLRIRELRAVVGEDDAEELPEEFRARDLPEAVEDAGACLGALVVAQEPKHDPARQVDREEHLAPDPSDDRV